MPVLSGDVVRFANQDWVVAPEDPPTWQTDDGWQQDDPTIWSEQ